MNTASLALKADEKHGIGQGRTRSLAHGGVYCPTTAARFHPGPA